MDHGAARRGVLGAIPSLALRRSKKRVIVALRGIGYDHMTAEQLTLLVPSALAWSLCRQAGFRSSPDHFVVPDDHGRKIRVPIANLHYFATTLRLGIGTLESDWLGKMPRRAYEQVVRRNAELDTIGKTLEQGGDLPGSMMQALMTYIRDTEAFARSGSVG